MAARNETHVERASDRELLITRVFRARPQTVYDAMTKPELLKRWWAPKSLGVELFSVESDLRVGGHYRYVFGRPGQEMAFRGTHQEIDPGRRVVYTQVFEPMAHMGEGVITATYEPHEGGTLFTQRECFPSKEVLEHVLSTGMEKGMRETLEQLADLVVALDEH